MKSHRMFALIYLGEAVFASKYRERCEAAHFTGTEIVAGVFTITKPKPTKRKDKK